MRVTNRTEFDTQTITRIARAARRFVHDHVLPPDARKHLPQHFRAVIHYDVHPERHSAVMLFQWFAMDIWIVATTAYTHSRRRRVQTDIATVMDEMIICAQLENAGITTGHVPLQKRKKPS